MGGNANSEKLTTDDVQVQDEAAPTESFEQRFCIPLDQSERDTVVGMYQRGEVLPDEAALALLGRYEMMLRTAEAAYKEMKAKHDLVADRRDRGLDRIKQVEAKNARLIELLIARVEVDSSANEHGKRFKALDGSEATFTTARKAVEAALSVGEPVPPKPVDG